jgi:hypothetical protein
MRLPRIRNALAGAVLVVPLLAIAHPVNAGDATFTVQTPATTVAARTDRRPMAGGVYDPVVNKTFISWAGKNEDSYVQEYNHATRVWSAPKFIDGGDADAHNYPTMIQANNGKLLIFRGMHNVELVVSEAPSPRSIGGTWTHRVIPQGVAASYPMPFKAANGDIYVFYRRTDKTVDPSAPSDQRPMLYVRSTDNGRTWRNSTQLTGMSYAVGSTGRSDNMDETYFGQMRYEPARTGRSERVHIVWTLAGGGPEGERHDRYHRNIHYAYFQPSNRRFYNAAGNDLGYQIGTSDVELRTKVVETPIELPAGFRSPDYIQLVGWQANGRPFVVWITPDSSATFHINAGHWNGSRWVVRRVTSGVRAREMEPVVGGWRIYASLELVPNIKTGLLSDAGVWTPGATISTAKPVQRIELITRFRDPARLLVSGESSSRDVSVADGDIHVIGVS